MKTVMVFGAFDLLHPGHLRFLQAARRRGDRLVVVITRDSAVRREKGRSPIFNERERLFMVGAIRWVDAAILGDRAGQWTVIRRVRPHVLCVGYDQDANHPAVRAQMSAVRRKPLIVQLPRYRSRRHKSSLIKRRIQRV